MILAAQFFIWETSMCKSMVTQIALSDGAGAAFMGFPLSHLLFLCPQNQPRKETLAADRFAPPSGSFFIEKGSPHRPCPLSSAHSDWPRTLHRHTSCNNSGPQIQYCTASAECFALTRSEQSRSAGARLQYRQYIQAPRRNHFLPKSAGISRQCSVSHFWSGLST